MIAQFPAQAVVADKDYDSDALVEQIKASDAQAAIAPRAHRRHPRPFERLQYRCRNIIERFLVASNSFAASLLGMTNSSATSLPLFNSPAPLHPRFDC
ncbi:transposase [Mycetohabitans sp. B8]|uniref:Transposase n=1 Tax=Mycetohabitans sp. TaxID=2571162 RepID=A0A6B9HDU1_9BURK|nr:transposase [Mycetohabitans sp. B8]QGY72927.1 hypothetical protein [Mycetohabitans sp.]